MRQLVERAVVVEHRPQVVPYASWPRLLVPPRSGLSRGSNSHVGPGPTSALVKPMVEMWPSPIARRLTATRT